jgi:sulfate adenylyltransferase subunit 2
MPTLDYLQRLESESIHIFREVVAECEKPVMLYSVGKDSSVMLHIAREAFAPANHRFLCCKSPRAGTSRDAGIPRCHREKFGLELLVHQ